MVSKHGRRAYRALQTPFPRDFARTSTSRVICCLLYTGSGFFSRPPPRCPVLVKHADQYPMILRVKHETKQARRVARSFLSFPIACYSARRLTV